MDYDRSMGAVLTYCDGFPLDKFKAGEVLIPEGPNTNRMYILAVGEVEVLRRGTPISRVASPGAIFGEIAALLDGPHIATVRARTDATAFRIDDARNLLMGHREISFHVSTILARRLTFATEYLADLKRQLADQADRLGMTDRVLNALVEHHGPLAEVGGNGRP